MSVLLDTHIWLWWITGAPNLDVNLRAAIDRIAGSHLPCISAISLWEAQMLVSKGRVQPAMRFEPWLRKITAPDIIDILAFDVDVAIAVHELPRSFHGDPADRLIVATAQAYGLQLATADDAIRRSRVVKLWKP